MPARKGDLTKYATYFNMSVPGIVAQLAMVLLLGALFGILAVLIVHIGSLDGILNLSLYGVSSGIFVISMPAILTVITIKGMKRSLRMKHAMFAALAISSAYSLFLLAGYLLYLVTGIQSIAYLLLLLGNVAVYGYWFFINKLAVGQRKSAPITASVQPLLNVIFYIPFGSRILDFNMPIEATLIKLSAGMLVFAAVGYAVIYIIDRPAKKQLDVSSVALFGSMVSQLLYEFTRDTKILGSGGVKRDVNIDILVLKRRSSFKAVFVKPDLHYGPFANIGGSVITEHLGRHIISDFKASPFIVHGAVNIDDNPISTTQVEGLNRQVIDRIASIREGSFRPALGSIGFGRDGQCRSINVKINSVNLLTVTKAPSVTEDISRNMGLRLERAAALNGASRTMLIDAHNSRYESAPPDDLKGIYDGSPYVARYERAIRQSVRARGASKMLFGSSARRLSSLLSGARDLGSGYSCVCVFSSKERKFCMVYFDANNMLPAFRKAVIGHVKDRFGLDAELYTTDTHSVNSLAMSASNSLGRYTRASEVMPILDGMVEEALKDLGPVSSAYVSATVKDFKTWGTGSEALITKVGMDIIRMSKRYVPFIIVLGFIIAAWLIYIV
ncbi:MAG: DUF2070 family protein [Candidatus Micrarchaeota archaeon]|nr:DUF2070 family protein [Candidatus Micrarchaeota archaeon]